MFELSEELTMVRDAARDFAERELKPRATKHDRQEHLDAEVLSQIAELGFWGLTVPEEYGGAGMGNLALSTVLEELNRGCAATGVTVSVHNSLLCAPILKWGSDEQKRRFLPKLASGEWIGAYCLTEPNSGSDAAALVTKAERDGDHYVLNGTKIWVTSGSMAGLALVYVRTNPDPKLPKAKGISAFLVETSTPGCRVGKKELKCGIRGSPATELVFENCRVPAANMLGALDKGFPIAMDTLDGGRIGIAAQSVGIAQACIEEAIAYAKVRV
ncbi:MAG: acyl-CoA dehydrogenase family protein, partial [Planctomycetota bacterium]